MKAPSQCLTTYLKRKIFYGPYEPVITVYFFFTMVYMHHLPHSNITPEQKQSALLKRCMLSFDDKHARQRSAV
jgi:hypothetical protein